MVNNKSSQQKPRRQTEYRDYLVTFIDIMGFKDLIEKEHEGTPKPILKIIRTFKKVNAICNYRMCDDKHNKRVLVNFFSDSIVRRIPLSGLSDFELINVLDFEMSQLTLIQMALIEEGILIRGSMSIGKLFSQKEIFFGPAFHEAYECESKMAVYPVIMLSHSVERYLAQMKHLLGGQEILSFYKSTIPFDCQHHGGTYLNYLYFLVNGQINVKQKQVEEFMMEHKKLIESSLNNHDHEYRIASKYRWLKKYHNYYVPLMHLKNKEDYLIK